MVLRNHTDRPLKMRKGRRIAQIILERYVHVAAAREESDAALQNRRTSRGERAFGPGEEYETVVRGFH